MKVRSYRRSDLPKLHEIDQTCFPPGISYSREELERFIRMRSARTWVAEEQGEIAGFVVVDRQPKGVAHIVTVDVIESRRRTGVGGALMEVAESWARQERCRLMYLETAEDNLAAQSFYDRHHYTRVERIPDYYSTGLAAWVMVKWLGPAPEARGHRAP
jgi:[ribosomal protein S18]-alanine N-acetyltransferase